MSRKIILIASLWIALSTVPSALFADDTIEKRQGNGIEIETDPQDAEILIDGILKGESPLSIGDLQTGSHHLLVRKDGYVERRMAFTIEQDQRLYLYLELTKVSGRLITWIDASEGGGGRSFSPSLEVDGKLMSQGTIELPSGFHKLRARAFGWEEETRSVYVPPFAEALERFTLRPAPFKLLKVSLSRKSFNPGNSALLGTTSVTFSVSAPGSGTLVVSDSAGRPVHTATLGPFTTWEQSSEWDGRADDGSALPDGTYTARLEVRGEGPGENDKEPQVEEVSARIDSTIELRPHSLSGALPGTLLCPAARNAPAEAFELEIGAFAIEPYGSPSAFKALPVWIGMTWAPTAEWGLSFAACERSDIAEEALVSISTAVQRNLYAGSSFFSAFALHYTWADEGYLSPILTESGVELLLPLEWRLQGAPLSFLFCPGIALSGEASAASSAVAISVRLDTLTASLSAKGDAPFSAQAVESARGIAALELRWFPPPSLFVFSTTGGAWLEKSGSGIFTSLSLGLIY